MKCILLRYLGKHYFPSPPRNKLRNFQCQKPHLLSKSPVIPRSLLLRIPPAGSTGGIHGRLLPLPRRENSSSGQPRTERGRSAPHKVSPDAVKASRRPRLGRWDSPCENLLWVEQAAPYLSAGRSASKVKVLCRRRSREALPQGYRYSGPCRQGAFLSRTVHLLPPLRMEKARFYRGLW
ncbi:hypothetical protein TNIN_98171 [Trichonephila inaurata madagascariensis]|uniref:Uncharacterized protein n=1 Tax=Trichonephila inaurata madagascariensis TaxID=2747483 RepID=A0A8X6JU81_9ARAC|nr:hypothetical protein TNIN_98171 [Trichonephila inaurata madagascariensis]